MNDTESETIRFSIKPSPALYAFEFTRRTLLVGTAVGLYIPFMFPGIYTERGLVVVLIVVLIAYVVFGLPLFIVAYLAAINLVFIVTDKRAIVRSSSGRTTMDWPSIAIESVKAIEIISHGATYGSVYLSYDDASFGDTEVVESDDVQPLPTRAAGNEADLAPVSITKANCVAVSMNHLWPRLLGFYGFKGFDDFARIISEHQDLVD